MAAKLNLDKLDLQILKLVNERASVAGEIGKLKNDHGEEIFSPAREEEVLQHVLQLNEKHKGTLDPATIHHVGMYVGQGLMVNAPFTGAQVRVEPLRANGYVGATRPTAR